ncbi:MAG TPA: carbonic anhydrase [Candidatus Obscuribacterales bacterium]
MVVGRLDEQLAMGVAMSTWRHILCFLVGASIVLWCGTGGSEGRTPAREAAGGVRATELPPLVQGLHHFSTRAFASSDAAYEQLIGGLSEFEIAVFPSQRRLFQKLSHGQHPKALFVTCSDSRIDPNLILHAHPGDLFVLRNIGNIIPAYASGEHSEAAVVEYAVRALGVREIIVCGHLDCGAMKALTQSSHLSELPEVRRWLGFDRRVAQTLRERYEDLPEDRLVAVAAEENVLVQIENLSTHPCVAEGLVRGTLKIHGWIYSMERGRVFSYNPATGQFSPLPHRLPVAHPHHAGTH